MKKLLFIAAILISCNSFGQLYNSPIIYNSIQMTATQTTTSIDPKFVEVQRCLTEAKRQIKRMNAQESISGNPKLKTEINQLLIDLQNVMKLNRPKFMDAKEFTWFGDSLQTVREKERLTAEIIRLNQSIINGEDSTYIQPQINQLQNRKNDLNKITKTWKRVTTSR